MEERDQFIAIMSAQSALIAELLKITHRSDPEFLPEHVELLRRAAQQPRLGDEIHQESLRLQIEAIEAAIVDA